MSEPMQVIFTMIGSFIPLMAGVLLFRQAQTSALVDELRRQVKAAQDDRVATDQRLSRCLEMLSLHKG